MRGCISHVVYSVHDDSNQVLLLCIIASDISDNLLLGVDVRYMYLLLWFVGT